MDYRIKPIGRTCSATGDQLVPGSVCRSVLVEKNGQLVRLDYAGDAPKGLPPGAIGWWRCSVPAAGDNKTGMLDTESLFDFFDQLADSPNPVQEKFLYVLGLLLVRKRRLKLDGTRSDGDVDYLMLSGSRGEGPWDVRDQVLNEDEIERLQKQLQAQLTGQ